MVSARSVASASAMSSPEGEDNEGVAEAGDEEEWEEVGPRNKSTITRRVSGVTWEMRINKWCVHFWESTALPMWAWHGCGVYVVDVDGYLDLLTYSRGSWMALCHLMLSVPLHLFFFLCRACV